MLKAVIFDLDGVITDSAKYHFLAWKKIADNLGINFDEEYNEKLKGVSRLDSLDLILENGNKENSFSDVEKLALADQKNEDYKELISTMTPEDILPGVKDFLIELKANGIKTAIASASRNAFYIIDKLDLKEYFDYIVDAALVKNAKPYPDVFLAAAEAVNVIPEECIGIEDAKAGIQAIKASNMKAVGVGTLEQMVEADLVLAGTHQLSLAFIKEELKL